MIVMIVSLTAWKMRDRVEENVAKETPHGKRKQNVSKAFLCVLIAWFYAEHVHCVDQEDGNDRDKGGWEERLGQKGQWFESWVQDVKQDTRPRNLNQIFDRFFVHIWFGWGSFVLVSEVIVVIMVFVVIRVIRMRMSLSALRNLKATDSD